MTPFDDPIISSVVGAPFAPAWTPPEDVSTHDGMGIDPSADFFVAPPAEIGEVLTAETTLRKGEKERSGLSAALSGLIWATGIAIVGWIAMKLAPRGSDLGPLLFIGSAILGVVVGIIVALRSRYAHTCTFIGRQGIARHRVSGSRANVRSTEIMRFADATDLYASITRTFVNGIPSGTNYDYTWCRGPEKIWRDAGSFAGHGEPKGGHAFHFTSLAETAWVAYLADGIDARLQADGYVEFRTRSGDRIRVAPEYVEFIGRKRTEHLAGDEIATAGVKEGFLRFRHRDAKLFSGKGKFTYAYGTVGNAQLLLHCLVEIAGIELQA